MIRKKISSLVLAGALALVAVFAPAKAASAKTIDIDASEYGYGKYVVTVQGYVNNVILAEDSALFYYLPVSATTNVDDTTGKHYVDLDYLTGNAGAEEIAKIVLNVYNESGELVEALSPITVLPPVKNVEIPFAAKNMPSGIYKISVSAYNANGERLYEPYILTIEYKATVVPDAGAPDTGGLFQNLNISKEDYLISGLMVFFVLGIVAFGVVARNKKTSSRRNRR